MKMANVADLLAELNLWRSISAEPREKARQAEEGEQKIMKKILDGIRAGDSTGDPIRDFLWLIGVFDENTPGEQMLRQLQDLLHGKTGQMAMIISREKAPLVEVSHPTAEHREMMQHTYTKTEYHIGVLTSDVLKLTSRFQQVELPTGKHVRVSENECDDKVELVESNLAFQFNLEYLRGKRSVLRGDHKETQVHLGNETVVQHLPKRRPVNPRDELRARTYSTLRRAAVLLNNPRLDDYDFRIHDRREVEAIMDKLESQLEESLRKMLSAAHSGGSVSAVRALDQARLLKQAWDYCLELGMAYPGEGHRFEWITKIEHIDFKLP